MKIREHLLNTKDKFLDELFEAAKVKPAGTKSDGGGNPSAKKSPQQKQIGKKQPSKETIEWWNTHSEEKQREHVQKYKDGEIAQLVKSGVLQYGKKFGGGQSGESDEIDVHGEHAKLIGNKDFTNIVTSPHDDKVKEAHFDNLLKSLNTKPDEKKALLDKIRASYNKKAPKWMKNVFQKHYKVSQSGQEIKPEEKKKPEIKVETEDIIKHIKNIVDKSPLIRDGGDAGKKVKGVYDNLIKDLKELDGLKGKEKKEKAERIKETYKLRVGSDGVLNIDSIQDLGFGKISHSGKKLIGSGANARAIINQFEDIGVSLTPTVVEKDASKVLSAASKPNLGMKGIDHKESTYVAEIFSEGPLADLDDGFKKVYLPTDANGKPIDNKKGKNAQEYFRHSVFNNKALDRTIADVEKLVKEGKIKKEFLSELKAHKERMIELADSNDVPSKSMSEKVGNSYATLACKLSEIDKKSADSIMKNFAEMALYDTEIARGDECYLPSHGSFPSGDKIRITRSGTKITKIQSISVKYGSSGEFNSYGFPGEASKYTLYHPDKKKRYLIHSVPGTKGYAIGVKDSIIDDKKEFDSIMKNSGGIHKTIKDMDGFYKMLVEYKMKTEAAIAKSSALGASEKEREALDKEYAEKLKKFVDYDSLVDMVGQDNAKVMINKGPNCFMSAVTFSHVLVSSKGLPMLVHNHQEYVDGQYRSEIDTAEDGTDKLKLWKLDWRPYGSRIQGLNAGFNSRRKNMWTSKQIKQEIARREGDNKAGEKKKVKKEGYVYRWIENVDVLVENYLE